MLQRRPPAEHPHAHAPQRRLQFGGLGHDERQGRLAPAAHHADLRHCRILRERRLHRRGRHLRPAGEHEGVDQPPGDPHMAVVVDGRDVARLEPAVAG